MILFLTDLKNINFDVKEGEIFGIAGVAGNGQSELMDFLTGENIILIQVQLFLIIKKLKLLIQRKEEIYQLLLFQKID